MATFHIQTLVDITRTGAYRREMGTNADRARQQNLDMLIQTVGLRANPICTFPPTGILRDLTDYKFGYVYSGEHMVWEFTIQIEYDGAFMDEFDNEYGLLETDLHLVPVVLYLSETAPIVPYFDTKNAKTCNTIIFANYTKY